MLQVSVNKIKMDKMLQVSVYKIKIRMVWSLVAPQQNQGFTILTVVLQS